MDPITRAMRRLAEDGGAFWRAYPGKLLPLIAEDDERSLVIQALRLWEHAPENRRPFVICEAPFTTANDYFAKLANQIATDYEAVREGAAEEGVELEPFPSPADALAAYHAARLLGDRFDGLVVALVPAHVADADAWRDSVRALAGTWWPERLRWAVFSPPTGPLAEVLGEEGARLQLDAGEELGFLKQAAPAGSLQALLLAATEAQSAGRIEDAAGLYHEARTICRTEGLREQEAAVLMALASACLAAGAAGLASRSYHEAAAIAEKTAAWAFASQAWLGVGGALVTRGKRSSAGVAYRRASALARRAGAEPLEAVARRLASELGANGGQSRGW